MKTPAFLLLAFFGAICTCEAAYYRVGQVVTNFLVYARAPNGGPVTFPENYPIQLRDFAGKILFVEFFDPT